MGALMRGIYHLKKLLQLKPMSETRFEQLTQRRSRYMKMRRPTRGACGGAGGPRHARVAGSLLERLFAAMGGLDGLFPGAPS
eukprot:5837918-Prymnesium_polylepis.1